MGEPTADSTVVNRGIVLRRDPAREPCFTVAHSRSETYFADDMAPNSRLQKLHADVNQEVLSLEIAAQCLIDFPATPWDLRLELARQCWDETRHARLYYDRLRELGGRKGQFPIVNHEWGVVCMLDSLAARLAVQNRTFEAGSMDLFRTGAKAWRDGGDERTAEILEAVLVDEIQHVRFANQWLKRMVGEQPRTLLSIVRAMEYLRSVTAAFAPRAREVSLDGVDLSPGQRSVPANTEDRRWAGFTDAEIAAVRRRDGAA